MKNILLLLASTIILVSCASSAPVATVSTDCPCPDYDPLLPYVTNEVTITYRYKADDVLMMSMRLRSKAKSNSQFKIKLKPLGPTSDDARITIVGVSGTLPNGQSTPFSWLNGNSTFNENPIIILNVPPDIKEGTSYKFDVNVEGIGMIDPRVDVN